MGGRFPRAGASAPARAILIVLVVAGLAGADVVLPAAGRDGWRAVTFPRIARHTVYTPVEIDGVEAVRAESHCAASALALRLAGVDLRATPRLAWQWRVDEAPDVPDQRVKAGDDFAARVYVMFRFDATHASVLDRLRRRAARAIYGSELPGNTIDYVWSRREPAGARWDNPFTTSAKMISLGSSAPGTWQHEEVDVAADYRSLFGAEPPPLHALAVMTDTDGSCQQAVAWIADFRFVPGCRGAD